LQHNVVHEAEILGNGEDRGDLAGRIGPYRGDLVRDGLVFSAVIFRARYLPAALHRAPDQLKIRVGRHLFRNDADPRARWVMLGRNRHAPDETMQRGEGHLAADLRGCARRRQQCDGKKNAARGSARTLDHRALTWREVRKCRRSRSAVTV
jgi:hypothetical protein